MSSTALNSPDRAAADLRRSAIWLALQHPARLLTTLLFDLHVHGQENVPKTGAALLACNHQSYLDPVLVGVRLRRPVSYMAKAELFENPSFAWLIRSLHAFPVRQGEGDVGAVKEMIRRLKEGHLVNIFPEGSRSPDGQIHPMLPGVGLIVRRAEVPVVPVAIRGAYDAWPIHRKQIRFAPIRVLYGRPMNLWHLKAGAIVQEIEKAVRGLHEELGRM